jgi:hypothetical protein
MRPPMIPNRSGALRSALLKPISAIVCLPAYAALSVDGRELQNPWGANQRLPRP